MNLNSKTKNEVERPTAAKKARDGLPLATSPDHQKRRVSLGQVALVDEPKHHVSSADAEVRVVDDHLASEEVHLPAPVV
ncbi:unnamed protein product [Phytophthora fragariaefolia]|uniref:Unnamed protein product n=1 Tax=Phytophthora fragariaefolia TaxID=1490495 RepID=A0A9W6XS59_9STRA|nr:unnamed protein product [Phytophthora fragariaefolia]